MPSPSDEDFFNLFKDGLAQYPEESPALIAWPRLAARLDAEARRRTRLRQWGAGCALLAILWLGLTGRLVGPPASRPARPTATAEATTGFLHPTIQSQRHTYRHAATAGQAVVAPSQSMRIVGSPSAPADAAVRQFLAFRATKAAAVAPAGKVAGPGQKPAARHLAGQSGDVWTNLTVAHTPPDQPASDRLLTRNQAALRVPANRPATLLAALGRRAPPAKPIRPTASVREYQNTPPALARRGRHAHPAAFVVKLVGIGQRQQLAGRKRPGPVAAPILLPAAAAGPTEELAPRRSGLAAPSYPLPSMLAQVALASQPQPGGDSLALPRPRAQLMAYRLRLGLVAAPELSAVHLTRLAAPGTSLGAQLDYRFAQRWHFSVSYLLTEKRYVADGSDYRPPTSYQAPHPAWDLAEVGAACRIVDIPLNLRYDLWPRLDRQFFVSAGLSSLLLRRERYTYYYSPNPTTGAPRPATDWELLNGSQPLLRVLNLSAGYERTLGPRWTVQAEPFLKLPLAGIGFGAIRLNSAGVFLSLRYGLWSAR